MTTPLKVKKLDNKPNRQDNTTMKPSKKERSQYAKYLGSIKSEKKSKASKENGKMGGRPRKKILEKS